MKISFSRASGRFAAKFLSRQGIIDLPSSSSHAGNRMREKNNNNSRSSYLGEGVNDVSVEVLLLLLLLLSG